MNMEKVNEKKFDYHLKLHHTQTNSEDVPKEKKFDYHLKLHHTQTSDSSIFAHQAEILNGNVA